MGGGKQLMQSEDRRKVCRKKTMKETDKKNGGKGKIFWFLILHIALLIYSMTGLFSKNASMHPFLSLPFILFYAGMIMILGIYAILWQQVIKHLPLTTAYVNKAVTVVWGVLLGIVFFRERISPLQACACVVIIGGTVLYVRADLREKELAAGKRRGEEKTQ